MENHRGRLKNAISLLFAVSLILTACRDVQNSQQDFLRNLNIKNSSDFAALSPCEQINIYAKLGSEYTDVDHMMVIAPDWMQKEIDKQPPDIVADCIVEEADNLLSQWGESYEMNQKISYSIHALLYKADELDFVKYPKLESLFNRVVCHEHVFDDGQLILIYYTAEYGINDLPSRNEMASVLCQ